MAVNTNILPIAQGTTGANRLPGAAKPEEAPAAKTDGFTPGELPDPDAMAAKVAAEASATAGEAEQGSTHTSLGLSKTAGFVGMTALAVGGGLMMPATASAHPPGARAATGNVRVRNQGQTQRRQGVQPGGDRGTTVTHNGGGGGRAWAGRDGVRHELSERGGGWGYWGPGNAWIVVDISLGTWIGAPVVPVVGEGCMMTRFGMEYYHIQPTFLGPRVVLDGPCYPQ